MDLCPGLAISQLFVLSVQLTVHHIIFCGVFFFFNQKLGILVHHVFLLLHWDCKSLCFYNSLGNTPTVLAGTGWHIPLPALSFQAITVFCPARRGLVSFITFSLVNQWSGSVSILSLFTDKFPWIVQLSSDVLIVLAKEGSMTHSFHLGPLYLIFYPPGMKRKLSSSFCGLFPICQPLWGQYSVYSCLSPCISPLGCRKVPATALYVYLIV